MNVPKKSAPYRSPFVRRSILKPRPPSGLGIVVAALVAIVAAVAIVVAKNGRDQDPGASQQSATPQIRVIDGDTLDVDGKRIRLFGIDAPEKGQPCTCNGMAYDCGAAATDQLRFAVAGEKLKCDIKSNDRWGREVAICMAGTMDIGRRMIRQGWAVAYREYSSDYVQDEEFARENSLGMWAKEFDLPKNWRHRGTN